MPSNWTMMLYKSCMRTEDLHIAFPLGASPECPREVYELRSLTTHLHANLCKTAFKYANRLSLRKKIKLYQLVSAPELKSFLVSTNQPPFHNSLRFRSQMTIIISAKLCFPCTYSFCYCFRVSPMN